MYVFIFSIKLRYKTYEHGDAAPIWHPIHDTETEMVETLQETAVRWTYKRLVNKSSAGDMLDELE